jgi:hypothetical protein
MDKEYNGAYLRVASGMINCEHYDGNLSGGLTPGRIGCVYGL